MKICCPYEMITNVQAGFEDTRNNSDNEFHNLHSKANSRQKGLAKLHLLNSEVKLFACWSLLVSFCSLPVTFCLLLVTIYSLRIIFCSLLITFCSLVVTFCLLLVTICSLLVMFCSLLDEKFGRIFFE